MKKQQQFLGAGAFTALGLTLLGAQALAQKTAPFSTPDMPDVKTAAPVVVKTPAAPLPVGALDDSARLVRTAQPLTHVNPLAGRIAYEDDAQGARAATTRWKAQFTREATTFVPFFGSKAERNVPLRFTTQSVSVAGSPVANVAGDVLRANDRVAIARGGIEEAWQLSTENAQQTFTIAAPLGAGDVTVRVGFEGQYSATQDADGVLFSNAAGSVRYGTATAIDAAGHRTAVRENLSEGAIDLVVPASFLAEAAYPVVIDPVVSTYSIDTSSAETNQVDVAYDGAHNLFGYVYEYDYSATDHDIYLVYGGDSAVFSFTTTTIDSSTDNWSSPSIASNRIAGNFLVVAEVGSAGSREIHGRRVTGGSTTAEPEFTIEDTTGGDKLHAVVGGDPSTNGPTYYCVAWERVWSSNDHDIQARIVDASAGGMVTHGLINVEGSSNTLDQFPAISKSNGKFPFVTQDWTIVWERAYAANDGDVYGRQIFWDGTLTQPTFIVDNSSNDDRKPVVSSIADGDQYERPYVVAWTRQMSTTDRDIIAAACRYDHVDDLMDVSAGIGSQTNDDATPSIDCDGHVFGLAWSKLYNVGDYDVWMSWLTVSGGFIGRIGNTESLALSSTIESSPAVTSKHSGGATSNRYAVGFQRFNGSDYDVAATIVDAPTSVPAVSYCAGTAATCPCGNGGNGTNGCASSVNPNGALLVSGGEAIVSADDFSLVASGMPASAPCLFFQGTNPILYPTGTTFGDGLRCVGGTVSRLGTKTASGGATSFPGAGDPKISVKGQLLPMGGARYYQVWYRNPGAFCTASTFNLTNALKATWLP